MQLCVEIRKKQRKYKRELVIGGRGATEQECPFVFVHTPGSFLFLIELFTVPGEAPTKERRTNASIFEFKICRANENGRELRPVPACTTGFEAVSLISIRATL
jgi:hypothetical protein